MGTRARISRPIHPFFYLLWKYALISYDMASTGLDTRDEVELIANKVLAPVSYNLGRDKNKQGQQMRKFCL